MQHLILNSVSYWIFTLYNINPTFFHSSMRNKIASYQNVCIYMHKKRSLTITWSLFDELEENTQFEYALFKDNCACFFTHHIGCHLFVEFQHFSLLCDSVWLQSLECWQVVNLSALQLRRLTRSHCVIFPRSHQSVPSLWQSLYITYHMYYSLMYIPAITISLSETCAKKHRMTSNCLFIYLLFLLICYTPLCAGFMFHYLT